MPVCRQAGLEYLVLQLFFILMQRSYLLFYVTNCLENKKASKQFNFDAQIY